jgi:sodium/potassium-transporting ATPase subunit alpha
MEIEEYRAANPKVHEVPFNSSNKWQMSIHTMKHSGTQLLLLKGAPDVLLDKCSHYLAEDGTHKPCDETFSAVNTAPLSLTLKISCMLNLYTILTPTLKY